MLVTTDRNNPGRFEGEGGVAVVVIALRECSAVCRGDWPRSQRVEAGRGRTTDERVS